MSAHTGAPLTDVDLDSIHYLAFNLRQVDREEIFNILEHDCPYRFGWEAFSLFRNKGRARIAWHKGKPAACIGLTESRTGVWEISMFGTEALKDVAFVCMRWARNEIPDLIRAPLNGKRLQCDSQVGHLEAHAFLKALGAQPEGPPMRCYGRDGSAYQRFVWILNENGFISAGGKAVGETS